MELAPEYLAEINARGAETREMLIRANLTGQLRAAGVQATFGEDWFFSSPRRALMAVKFADALGGAGEAASAS